jgi:cbb3-type cytochrome oxidase maturation protein
MDSLYILIPIAVFFAAIAAKLFFWAVDNNQFDDLETEGQRILFDDDKAAADSARRAESESKKRT